MSKPDAERDSFEVVAKAVCDVTRDNQGNFYLDKHTESTFHGWLMHKNRRLQGVTTTGEAAHAILMSILGAVSTGKSADELYRIIVEIVDAATAHQREVDVELRTAAIAWSKACKVPIDSSEKAQAFECLEGELHKAAHATAIREDQP